jgi:acyl-CoA thioesterase I
MSPWFRRIGRIAFFVAGMLALPQPAVADPLKILFVGDSITEGGNRERDESTYRVPLQALIGATGVAVDYVGTRAEGLHRDARWPLGFDPHHEAYYGKTTGYVRDQLREHLGRFDAPDIALIHLGTNDRDNDETIQSLEDIVRLLRSRNPSVVVLVGQLAQHDWKAPWRRLRIGRMVDRLNTPESPVVAVNHFEDWVADPNRKESDTYDWIHPNPRGQSHMALAWFAALRPYLKGTSAPV